MIENLLTQHNTYDSEGRAIPKYNPAEYDESLESPIEGLGEEELERRESRHARELRAQRDSLLQACEAIHEWLETDDAAQALPFEPPWYEQLRVAIAKAKGE